MSKPNDTDEQSLEDEETLEAMLDDSAKIEIDVDDAAIDALGHDEVKSLKARLQDAEDRALRSQAELENYRRRARRELDEQRKFANQPLLMDLFPVMDNVDRAIEAATQATDSSGLLEGFQMVAQQLVGVLEKHDCKKILALAERFDPALHEAISQMPSDEYPAGTVMLVAQEGYMLHDRAIRPAHVIVSTGSASQDG
jgi:molecular chaperone GrpE